MKNKVFSKKAVVFLLMTLFLTFVSAVSEVLQNSTVIKLENFYAQDFESEEVGTVTKSESDDSGTIFAVEEENDSKDNESDQTQESSDISGVVTYQETGDNDFLTLYLEILLFSSYMVMIISKYMNSSKKCVSE